MTLSQLRTVAKTKEEAISILSSIGTVVSIKKADVQPFELTWWEAWLEVAE